MGSSIVKETRRQLRSDQLNWTLLSCSPYCLKVQDKIAGIMGEKYTIEEELLEREWKLYLLRHSHPEYLVTIYDILPQQTQPICSTSRELGVVCEHIPYRLTDLGAIDYEQGLYIITAVLRGYKVLKENGVDFYLLDENNVCFNRKGKCKIWLNQRLSHGKPPVDRRVNERQFLESVYLMLQARVSDKKGFFQKNLTAVKNLTLEYLLHDLQRLSTNTLLCMESLKNLNTETSRSNNLTFDKNFNKIASPQKRDNLVSPGCSLHKKEAGSLYSVCSGKKLSLAGKKREPHLTENKSLNSIKSNDISPKHMQPPKDTTYHSAIFAPNRNKEICNYSQIFSKHKVHTRESVGSQGLYMPPIPKSSFKRLKFKYNNSAKKL